MNDEQIMGCYWVGLARTKDKAKHLHNLYRDLFGQPFHKSNHVGMFGMVKAYVAELVFKDICDLLDWKGFVPTRNIIPALRHVVMRRHEHNQMADFLPEMVDLTDYMKGLANVR